MYSPGLGWSSIVCLFGEGGVWWYGEQDWEILCKKKKVRWAMSGDSRGVLSFLVGGVFGDYGDYGEFS